MDLENNIIAGEWICPLEGIALAEKIHTYYYEEYDCIPQDKRIGDFKNTLVEYKLFCDYEGKPIKRNRLKYQPGQYCDPIDNEYNTVLTQSIKAHPKEYASFVKFLKVNKEQKTWKHLEYPLAIENKEKAIQDLERIKNALPEKFTFEDIQRIAKTNQCMTDLSYVEKDYDKDLHVDVNLTYTLGDFEGKRILFHRFGYDVKSNYGTIADMEKFNEWLCSIVKK